VGVFLLSTVYTVYFCRQSYTKSEVIINVADLGLRPNTTYFKVL